MLGVVITVVFAALWGKAITQRNLDEITVDVPPARLTPAVSCQLPAKARQGPEPRDKTERPDGC